MNQCVLNLLFLFVLLPLVFAFVSQNSDGRLVLPESTMLGNVNLREQIDDARKQYSPLFQVKRSGSFCVEAGTTKIVSDLTTQLFVREESVLVVKYFSMIVGPEFSSGAFSFIIDGEPDSTRASVRVLGDTDEEVIATLFSYKELAPGPHTVAIQFEGLAGTLCLQNTTADTCEITTMVFPKSSGARIYYAEPQQDLVDPEADTVVARLETHCAEEMVFLVDALYAARCSGRSGNDFCTNELGLQLDGAAVLPSTNSQPKEIEERAAVSTFHMGTLSPGAHVFAAVIPQENTFSQSLSLTEPALYTQRLGVLLLPAASGVAVAFSNDDSGALLRMAANTAGRFPEEYVAWLPLACDYFLFVQSAITLSPTANYSSILFEFQHNSESILHAWTHPSTALAESAVTLHTGIQVAGTRLQEISWHYQTVDGAYLSALNVNTDYQRLFGVIAIPTCLIPTPFTA